MNLYLIALLLYSVFLMALGIVMSLRVKSSADFLVAGRSLGTGRLFATFLAANIGAGSTVGATGLGYRLGMSAWWWVGSACIGTFLLSQFLGPRIWKIAKEHGLATLQDYLEFRYSRSVKAVISVLFWFGALAILAGQLIAISRILNTIAEIPKWEGCLIGGHGRHRLLHCGRNDVVVVCEHVRAGSDDVGPSAGSTLCVACPGWHGRTCTNLVLANTGSAGEDAMPVQRHRR